VIETHSIRERRHHHWSKTIKLTSLFRTLLRVSD